MTIEKLDDSRILISLYKKDIDGLSLDSNKMTMKNPEFKDAVKAILSLAVCETELNTTNKKAVIEALPYDDGCFLLVSFIKIKTTARKFRIKRPKTNIFSFFCLDDLINLSIQAVKNKVIFPQNTVYELKGKYFLATSELDKNAEDLIKEYSDKSNRSFFDATKSIARLEEYGSRIASENAIMLIGKAMIHSS